MNLNRAIEDWLVSNRQQFHCVHRPFVTLCYAQGWDGSITTRAGESLALSNEESTRLTHQLRSMHDGIMVGIGTVLTDDPQLTVREWSGSSPRPIVLDSQMRIPATARLCGLAGRRCWVLTTRACTDENDEGPEYITLQCDDDGRVNLHEALSMLSNKGIGSLMVEGGANVISAFLKERLADALVLTIAPTMIGGYKAVNDLGFSSQRQLPQISPLHTGRLGDDLIMWGNLRYDDQSP